MTNTGRGQICDESYKTHTLICLCVLRLHDVDHVCICMWEYICMYVYVHADVLPLLLHAVSVIANWEVLQTFIKASHWKCNENVTQMWIRFAQIPLSFKTNETNNYSFRIVLTSLVCSWCQIIQSRTFHTLEQTMILGNQFLDHTWEGHSSNLYFMFLPHRGVEWKEEWSHNGER
jgi:hypothetical protein